MAQTSLVTSDSNVVTSRSQIQQTGKKSQVEKFCATQAFHTKFTEIGAIIWWTMPLEIVFHLPQRSFSFVSVLLQDKSCCDKNKFRS